MSKNWIQGAKIKKGALTKTAKGEGKSLDELCSGDVTGKTAQRCALRKTLRSFNK